MINKVYKTIKEYGLLQNGDKIVIGLSGGADSMCLTYILHTLCGKLGISLMTAHMNHNIRGSEALRDEAAARDFSESLGIPFSAKSVNVPEYAQKKGISEELAGRELRYSFFNELLVQHGFNKIATAHNRNDNAETIIMNFMRGSGIKGLCGIPHMRGNIIRPILDITRSEIEDFCRENSLPYVTDSTNYEKIYTRNKIRLDLIPEIENSFNPNFTNTVTENAAFIAADNEFLEDAASDFCKKNLLGGKISVSALLGAHSALRNRIIMKMIAEAAGNASDFSSDFVVKILELAEKNKSGSYLTLPRGIRAAVEYGKFSISQFEDVPEFEYKLPINEKIYIKELKKNVIAESVTGNSGSGIYIAADESDCICVRNRRNGDVFFPIGMDGRKKLKNFFIDCKIPRNDRAKMPIITVNGEIAAVGSKRIDRRFNFEKKGIKITFI